MHAYRNIVLKLDRVSETMSLLREKVAKFQSTNPYELRYEIDEPSRSIIYKLKEPGTEVPISIRILAGEIVTHLRCTLDHLVWQIALESGSSPNGKTEFPIFLDKRKYFSDSQRERKIGCLPSWAQSKIDALQPFNHPKKSSLHPLWLLHTLANEDKHRTITLVAALPAGLSIASMPEVECRATTAMIEIEGCDEVARFTFDEWPVDFNDRDVEKIGLTLPVGFCLRITDDNEIREVVRTLEWFEAEVKMVARDLVGIFPLAYGSAAPSPTCLSSEFGLAIESFRSNWFQRAAPR